MFDTFGNKVRIKRTSETVEIGLADKEGEVYGQTTPSMMDIIVIGTLREDVAVNVHFEDLDESFWFAEDLIEHLNNGSGTEITLDGIDKKWTKGSNGEWIEEVINPEPKIEQKQSKNLNDWWKFWKK